MSDTFNAFVIVILIGILILIAYIPNVPAYANYTAPIACDIVIDYNDSQSEFVE